MQHRS